MSASPGSPTCLLAVLLPSADTSIVSSAHVRQSVHGMTDRLTATGDTVVVHACLVDHLFDGAGDGAQALGEQTRSSAHDWRADRFSARPLSRVAFWRFGDGGASGLIRMIVLGNSVREPCVAECDRRSHNATVSILEVVFDVLVKIAAHSTDFVFPSAVQGDCYTVSAVEYDSYTSIHLEFDCAVSLSQLYFEPILRVPVDVLTIDTLLE